MQSVDVKTRPDNVNWGTAFSLSVAEHKSAKCSTDVWDRVFTAFLFWIINKLQVAMNGQQTPDLENI